MEDFRFHPFIYLCGIPLVFAALLLRRVWRLCNVPGPFLSHFTDLLRVYHQARGNLLPWLTSIHEQYGTVVRIGPNCVSVSDPRAVPSIYTMHGEFRKADSYHSLRAWSKGVSKGSVIDMQDEKLNADMKRALRGAFAAKNVLDFDDEVDKQILALKKRLQEDGTVSIMELFSQYQVDFFSKVAFGQTSHFLEDRTSTAEWSFNGRLKHWQIFQGMPRFEAWLYQSWLSVIWRKEGGPSLWMKYALDAINSRKACRAAEGEHKTQRVDLLEKYLQARTTHPHLFDDESLLRLVGSTVSAGFDSTPMTMNSIIVFLCQNPHAYKCLKEEIVQAHKEGRLSEIPKWTEVNKLPYLDAVMKEAMRLYPFLNTLLEREVRSTGTEINGYRIPGNTTIGCHSTLIGRDKAFYGADANDFRPERWFTDHRAAMERISLVFGSGKRMCIGLHIADLEIKKTIPVMIRDFEMRLADVHSKLESADGITSFPVSLTVEFTEPRSQEFA